MAREETRWFPAMVSNHVKDLIDRYGTDGSVVPKALTDYVEARKFYDYNDHSRVGAAHGAFVTDEICDRFSVLGTVEQATDEAAGARGDRRRPLLDLPDDAQPGGDARGLRRAHHPGLQGRDGIDDDRSRSRSRPGGASPPAGSGGASLFARATALLSGRMIELLDPQPGQQLLELAAGPGRDRVPRAAADPAGRRAPLDGRRARDGRGRPAPRGRARARRRSLRGRGRRRALPGATTRSTPSSAASG